MRCNICKRQIAGTTAYDGSCECGGLIEEDKLNQALLDIAKAQFVSVNIIYEADFKEEYPDVITTTKRSKS